MIKEDYIKVRVNIQTDVIIPPFLGFTTTKKMKANNPQKNREL